ncbi:MAG: ABC transporter ATP-binding protein, partial [Leucobacter sp.]|nr:ABC transporter ATP-binding protein [Leucobacter sp.]
VIAGAVLILLATVLAGVESWLSQWAGAHTEARLRHAVVSRMFQRGALDAGSRAGELLAMVTHATEKAAHYRAGFIGPMIGALTTPLVALVVMALMVDAATAGWLALLLLLVPLLAGAFQRFVASSGAAYRIAQARLTASFLESVQALGTLVYSRAAARAAAQLAERGEEHRRSLMRMLAVNQLLILVIDAAFSLAVIVAAVLLALGSLAVSGLTVGGAIAIVLMTVLIIGPVSVVGQFFYIGIGGRAAQAQLSDYLGDDQPTQRPNHADSVSPSDNSGTSPRPTSPRPTSPRPGKHDAISLRGVTAGWPGNPAVLRDLNLTVAPGERVALVGPSGVGKSTLSALVQGQLQPLKGEVLVGGHDTRTADPARIRTQLAVVEQRAFLFFGSIADNLRLADPSATQEQLWRALEIAGLRADVEAMPEGLDTHIGEHGALLSGGQAQRLAIARAALRDAPILILDEPTSQVDLAVEASILQALDRLAQGRTVLTIAHRPAAVLAADRVVELRATAATEVLA